MGERELQRHKNVNVTPLSELKKKTALLATEEKSVNWYALRVFHGKVFALESMLRDMQVETYLPTETVVVERDGVKQKKRRATIPSLIFLRTHEETLVRLRDIKDIIAVPYRRKLADGKSVPAVIPAKEMEMFILVSSSGEKGLEYIDSEKLNLNEGNRVRVIDGIFKGSEGYIKRIKGNRRFIVCINGVCAIATPYIPVAFLEKISDA